MQLIQNTDAAVLTNIKKVEHVKPVLALLHQLPVCQRIDFKILLLVYKALNGLRLKNISGLLVCYEASRPIRSSGTGLPVFPGSKSERLSGFWFQCSLCSYICIDF